MNLIFTCGGTAGHINPAIAVANMMRERHPGLQYPLYRRERPHGGKAGAAGGV